MDKVIDGVNVSECDRLRTYRDWTYSSDKWCGISNDGGCECDQNPNCYYKQLQRLKEELRTERIHSSQIEELEESLQHAKAENEKLIDQNFKIAQKYTKLEQENERLKAESENYCIQLQVLAQALEDIRDISNKHDYWRGSLQSATNIINDILDKINSVIGGE